MRWAAAEAEFRKLLELSPVDDYAHYALGRALQKQGRFEEAGRHLKLARCLGRTALDGEAVEREDREPGPDQASSRSDSSVA
jgi:tetratricopeptide (TPR) repeat protein